MTTSASSCERQDAVPIDAHEHGWEAESRHTTSAGHVLYVRCRVCGARRVDLQERADLPPAALSVAVRAPASEPSLPFDRGRREPRPARWAAARDLQ